MVRVLAKTARGVGLSHAWHFPFLCFRLFVGNILLLFINKTVNNMGSYRLTALQLTFRQRRMFANILFQQKK